jgi:hypothetical protein
MLHHQSQPLMVLLLISRQGQPPVELMRGHRHSPRSGLWPQTSQGLPPVELMRGHRQRPQPSQQPLSTFGPIHNLLRKPSITKQRVVISKNTTNRCYAVKLMSKANILVVTATSTKRIIRSRVEFGFLCFYLIFTVLYYLYFYFV